MTTDETQGSDYISGETVARQFADAGADVNGLPRGEGAAVQYELQAEQITYTSFIGVPALPDFFADSEPIAKLSA